MNCGLSPALSMMVTLPALVPVAVGMKDTEIVQKVLAETPLAQVSFSAKSPLALMLVKVSVALPVLVRTTF